MLGELKTMAKSTNMKAKMKDETWCIILDERNNILKILSEDSWLKLKCIQYKSKEDQKMIWIDKFSSKFHSVSL